MGFQVTNTVVGYQGYQGYQSFLAGYVLSWLLPCLYSKEHPANRSLILNSLGADNLMYQR